jgi:uncharacterized protein
MKERVREFQVFTKPVGSSCNLQCSYCYYLVKKKLYPDTGSFIMNDELLEKYIIQHIEASDDQVIMFSWHGGEPTLAGIDFFKRAARFQKKHLPSGRSAMNGIQTNGTLINNEWCSFFADEGFIAGISIDGPGELHNHFRLAPGGERTLERVLNGYELLMKYNVPVEILCVVNAHNADYPLVVYDFFKQLNTRYITFLPLVERLNSSVTGVSSASVPAEKFGLFLISVFNEWLENDIGRIEIQIFEEAIRSAFNKDHTLCIFKVNCGGVPVVEHNGDFYSCDHYVRRDHLIGNITMQSLAEMLDSPEQQAFGKLKSETLPEYCRMCSVKSMCNGECPKNRFISTPGGDPGLNYLCQGYKMFFTHCLPFIEALKKAQITNHQSTITDH